MKDFEVLKKRWMEDPEFRAEYERLKQENEELLHDLERHIAISVSLLNEGKK